MASSAVLRLSDLLRSSRSRAKRLWKPDLDSTAVAIWLKQQEWHIWKEQLARTKRDLQAHREQDEQCKRGRLFDTKAVALVWALPSTARSRRTKPPSAQSGVRKLGTGSRLTAWPISVQHERAYSEAEISLMRTPSACRRSRVLRGLPTGGTVHKSQ